MDRLTLQNALDRISALRSVELNATELCTRQCSFCPRHDPELYPNRNLHMTLSSVDKLTKDLADIDYNGRVGFVGYSEPLLYKHLEDAISLVNKNIPKISMIEVNTNGDLLTRERAETISRAGCTHITVSMYDGDESKKFKKIVSGINVILSLKHCYNDRFDLKLVNRTDIARATTPLRIERQCYIPFYKMFIDWDGDVLLCSNDWAKKGVVGNINDTHVKDIWLGKELTNYRRLLKRGKRQLNPCRYCDADGTKLGIECFSLF